MYAKFIVFNFYKTFRLVRIIIFDFRFDTIISEIVSTKCYYLHPKHDFFRCSIFCHYDSAILSLICMRVFVCSFMCISAKCNSFFRGLM